MRDNNSQLSHFKGFEDIHIPLSKSKIRLAVVQLFGPHPDAKVTVTRDDGSIASEWRTGRELELRCSKVMEILDWLHGNEPNVNVVIFPEYTFPCQQIIDKIKKRANEYKMIVVAGADTPSLKHDMELHNYSPVIIPDMNPSIHMIAKQCPSKWESEYVKPVTSNRKKRFVWTVNGKTYWMMIYVCLDFLERSLEQSYLANIQGPGLFIVPMCSITIQDFQLYSETLMRRPGGTATVICNAVGVDCVGKSSVYCFHCHSKEILCPAMQLPKNIEALGVFDLDMDNLSPPKITPIGGSGLPPLSNPKYLGIDYQSGSLEIQGILGQQSSSSFRGVINPYLFHLLTKKMRIAFLKVESFGGLNHLPENLNYECLAVLGEYDVVLTHIDHYEQTLFFDVERIPGAIAKNGTKLQSLSGGIESTDLPFYEVSRYYKVLGIKVDERYRDIKVLPGASDLLDIIKLGKNWNDPSISEDRRKSILSKHWIIDTTEKTPGAISAIVTVSLENRSADLERRLRQFEETVIPRILDSKEVTSAFRGTGHRINIDFLLRITSSVDSLFGFIASLHKWAEGATEMVTTKTHILMKRFSDVSIDQCLRLEELSPPDKQYAERYFYIWLSDVDKLRADSRPKKELESLLSSYKVVEQEARESKLFSEKPIIQGNWNLDQLCGLLAKGLLYFSYPVNDDDVDEGFLLLAQVHDQFNKPTESYLSNLIEQNVDIKEFEQQKAKCGILSQKKIDGLSYLDKLKLLNHVSKEHEELAMYYEEFQKLLDTANLRNIFAHMKKTKLADLPMKNFAESISNYIPFLTKHKEML